MRDVAPDELSVERALVVGAHPDDCEFSAGGTVGRLIAAGARVSLLVCTDGGRGGRGVPDVANVRRREQAAAAKCLGLADVVQLDRPDGELVSDDALRAEIVRAIRRTRPQLVLTHDPRTLWREFRSRAFLGHTDHRATGQATLDAIYPRSGNPNFFPEQLEEGLELWTPARLWLFDTGDADLRVDVTESFQAKLDALAQHESQQGSGRGLIEAARAVGARLGSPDRPAEVFKELRLS